MTAWSYSSLSQFETCPRQYGVIRVHKLAKDVQYKHRQTGVDSHKALEDRVRGHVPLPPAMAKHEPMIAALLAAPGRSEAETRFALNEKLEPVDFFAKDVWVRGIIDFQKVNGAQAMALDWKDGKPREDTSQLRLFAASMFQLHPQVQTVRTGYVWLNYELADKKTYERVDSPGIWEEFRVRVKRVDDAVRLDDFPPRPSGLCRKHCPVPRTLCEFSGA